MTPAEVHASHSHSSLIPEFPSTKLQLLPSGEAFPALDQKGGFGPGVLGRTSSSVTAICALAPNGSSARAQMHWLYHTIRHALVHWGYWAVLAGLLAENAGLPVPGETTLMFASFLSHKVAALQLYWVILVGIVAAVLGDNIGFWLGRKLGSRLIRWMKKIFRLDDVDIGAAKDQFRRHGAATVFWARYIFGLRTLAGPLAGVLGMEWKEFLLFNVLGAASWVTAIACIGFAFANQFQSLLSFFEKISWAMAGGLFVLGYFLWRHQKKQYRERHRSRQPNEKAA